MKLLSGLSTLLFIASFVVITHGHGRLLEPPSRASMWRKINDPLYQQTLLPFKDCIESDYNDNQLFCGGKQIQHGDNGGKCGVCGDPFHNAVKQHEAGGKFAKGIITSHYKVGELIKVVVDITAAHKGYFEFRLCPWNNTNAPVSQECLDRNLLTFEDGGTRYYLRQENPTGFYNMYVRPPQDMKCSQCFLQWRYRTGNSWGYDDDGSGLGFGPQEEFYGCADIAIGTNERQPTTCGIAPSSPPLLTSTRPTVTSTTTRKSATSSSSNISPELEGMCNEATMDERIHCLGCDQFFLCVGDEPVTFNCNTGTVCNDKMQICDYPYNVPRCQNMI